MSIETPRARRLHALSPRMSAAAPFDDRHALPARAERLPAHRPRRSRSASTSASPATSAAAVLRLDDTNPVKEEQEYIDAIERDSAGSASTGASTCHASDYFEQLDWAVHLIRNGDAYVDDLSADEIREHRGTLTEPVATRRGAIARSRRTSTSSRGCGPASSPTAPAEDRHGIAEHQPARPGALPDPPRRAPADRRRVAHLPTYDFAHGQSDAIEVSPIRSARSSSRRIGRSTTG